MSSKHHSSKVISTSYAILVAVQDARGERSDPLQRRQRKRLHRSRTCQRSCSLRIRPWRWPGQGQRHIKVKVERRKMACSQYSQTSAEKTYPRCRRSRYRSQQPGEQWKSWLGWNLVHRYVERKLCSLCVSICTCLDTVVIANVI